MFLRFFPVQKYRTLRLKVSEYLQMFFWLVGDVFSYAGWRNLRIIFSGAIQLAGKFAAMGVMYYFINIIETDSQASVFGVPLPGPDSPELLGLGVLGMVICLVIAAIFRFETRRQSLRIGRQYEEFCSRRIFVQMTRLPHPEAQWAEEQVASGEVTVYQNNTRVCGRVAAELVGATPALAGFVISSIVLIVIDAGLTATISMLAALVLMCQYPVNRKAAWISQVLDDHRKGYARRIKSLTKILRHASIPLSMDSPVLNRTFEDESVRAVLDGVTRRRRMSTEAGLVSELGAALILASLLVIIGTGLIEGTRSWSEAVVYLAALRYMLRDFANTSKVPVSINRFYVQINQLFVFYRSASKALASEIDPSAEPFEQVQFDIPKYEDGEDPLFAQAGRVVAFLGPRRSSHTVGGILLAAQVAPANGLRELPIQIDTMLIDPGTSLRNSLALPKTLSDSDAADTLQDFAPEGEALDWATPGWLDQTPDKPWDEVLPIWAIYALQALAALQRQHPLIVVNGSVLEDLGARWSEALKQHLEGGVLFLVHRKPKHVGACGETAVIVSDGEAARAWIAWDGSDEGQDLLVSAYEKYAEDLPLPPGVSVDDLLDEDEDDEPI